MEAKAEFFSAKELRCKCNKCKGLAPHKISQASLQELDFLRECMNQPLTLTSAYRCSDHPEEAKKSTPGQHNLGTAFDIRVTDGAMAYRLMQIAFYNGWTGIALGNGFVHVDRRTSTPVTWRY